MRAGTLLRKHSTFGRFISSERSKGGPAAFEYGNAAYTRILYGTSGLWVRTVHGRVVEWQTQRT